MRASRSEFHDVRGIRHHVRVWGEDAAPAVFLLHGWMDSSASFQFLADAMPAHWRLVAPDWRGYGRSGWQNSPYWFPDYLADLDVLLERIQPDGPVRLVGHSMGGNIASLYAGVRPQRVERLASVEGFGLVPTDPADAPARYGQWLEQARQGRQLRSYASLEAYAERLRRDNPRLADEQARFLAGEFHLRGADGVLRPAADPWHRVVYPVLYRIEEAKACWRCIGCPVLWVLGRDSALYRDFEQKSGGFEDRKASFRDLREVVIADCGHMVQHDQPARLAGVLDDFFCARD